MDKRISTDQQSPVQRVVSSHEVHNLMRLIMQQEKHIKLLEQTLHLLQGRVNHQEKSLQSLQSLKDRVDQMEKELPRCLQLSSEAQGWQTETQEVLDNLKAQMAVENDQSNTNFARFKMALRELVPIALPLLPTLDSHALLQYRATAVLCGYLPEPSNTADDDLDENDIEVVAVAGPPQSATTTSYLVEEPCSPQDQPITTSPSPTTPNAEDEDIVFVKHIPSNSCPATTREDADESRLPDPSRRKKHRTDHHGQLPPTPEKVHMIPPVSSSSDDQPDRESHSEIVADGASPDSPVWCPNIPYQTSYPPPPVVTSSLLASTLDSQPFSTSQPFVLRTFPVVPHLRMSDDDMDDKPAKPAAQPAKRQTTSAAKTNKRRGRGTANGDDLKQLLNLEKAKKLLRRRLSEGSGGQRQFVMWKPFDTLSLVMQEIAETGIVCESKPQIKRWMQLHMYGFVCFQGQGKNISLKVDLDGNLQPPITDDPI